MESAKYDERGENDQRRSKKIHPELLEDNQRTRKNRHRENSVKEETSQDLEELERMRTRMDHLERYLLDLERHKK